MCRLSAWPFRPSRPARRPGAGSAVGLTVPEATDLLDLLERRGVTGAEVTVAGDGSVGVRWGPAADPGRTGSE
jgi:hypothetical protein